LLRSNLMGFRQRVVLASVTFSVLIIGLSSLALAQESTIPDWIKNTAAWWAEGAVGDSDYINSLQWLISEEIIIIPQAEKTAEPEKQYMTKEFKFTMWQPDNWERQLETIDPTFGYSTSSIIESSTITDIDATIISVNIEALGGLSLEEYVSAGTRLVEEVAGPGNYRTIDKGFTTIDGKRAYLELSTLDIGIKLKSKQYIIDYRGEAYVITYNTAEKNFDKHLDQFDEIMKTFELL